MVRKKTLNEDELEEVAGGVDDENIKSEDIDLSYPAYKCKRCGGQQFKHNVYKNGVLIFSVIVCKNNPTHISFE